MNKTRADSIWAGLPPAQRETLEGWLFDENLSYREVQERAEQEFGMKGSLMSLARFYRQTNEGRRLRRMAEVKIGAGKIMEPQPGGVNLEAATVKLLELSAYELALAGPEKLKLKKLSWLMKALLQNRRQMVREKEIEMLVQKAQAEGLCTMMAGLREQSKNRSYTRQELTGLLQLVRQEFFREDEHGRKLPPEPPAEKAEGETEPGK